MNRTTWLLLGLLTLSGCASAANERSPAPVPDEPIASPASDEDSDAPLNRRVRLVACPGVPGDGMLGGIGVPLSFRVDVNGRVDPSSIVVRQTRRTQGPPAWAVEQARRWAESCVYLPALRDGVPVEARAQRRFSVPR